MPKKREKLDPDSDSRHALIAQIARLEQERDALKAHIAATHSVIIALTYLIEHSHVDHVDPVTGEVLQRRLKELLPAPPRKN